MIPAIQFQGLILQYVFNIYAVKAEPYEGKIHIDIFFIPSVVQEQGQIKQ